MEKVLTPAPPPIGGWLMLIAYKLLLILMYAVNNLIFGLPNLSYPTDVPGAIPPFVFLLYDVVILALSVYAALLFFGRRREFKPAFIALLLLDAVPIAVGFIISYSQMSEYGFFSIAEALHFILPYIVPVLFSLACVAYLCFSQRVKSTFVFSRNAPDPDIRHTKAETDRQPLQIYGLAIVAGIQAVGVAHSSIGHFLLFLRDLFGTGAFVPEGLLYGVVAAASVAAILLFFARRKLFCAVFIALLGVCIAYNVYNTYIYCFSPDANVGAQTTIWVARSALYVAYYIALIVYTLVSKRVKRTFVYVTGNRITKEKLVSFGYRVLRVKEDGEEEGEG